jgi:hypothetical protein
MRTRSVVLATTLTVGLVAGVGSSALAIAFVPGDTSGVTEGVQAIATPTQDPAEGSTSWFIAGSPVTVAAPETIVIDGGPTAKPAPSTEAKSTEDKATEDKAKSDAEDEAKNDAEDKAKKAAEEQAKKDAAKKAAAEEAKKDKAKKDKKVAEDKAKDHENESEDVDEDESDK